MELRFYGFPLLLVGGAAWLTFVEIRHFRSDHPHLKGAWARLLRRLLGACLLLAVGVLFQLGDTSSPAGLAPEEALRRFHYWMATLGVVLLAAGLAMWDVVAELRRLKNYVDVVERDELQNLRQRLKERDS